MLYIGPMYIYLWVHFNVEGSIDAVHPLRIYRRDYNYTPCISAYCQANLSSSRQQAIQRTNLTNFVTKTNYGEMHQVYNFSIPQWAISDMYITLSHPSTPSSPAGILFSPSPTPPFLFPPYFTLLFSLSLSLTPQYPSPLSPDTVGPHRHRYRVSGTVTRAPSPPRAPSVDVWGFQAVRRRGVRGVDNNNTVSLTDTLTYTQTHRVSHGQGQQCIFTCTV